MKIKVIITGATGMSFPNLDADKNIYAPTGTTTTIRISDNNFQYYFTRTYSVTFSDTNLVLQPYLVSKSTGLLTTINSISATTNEPLPNITFKIYKYVSGVGRTYVEQVVTDSKGQGLVLLLLNNSYDFECYNGTTFIKTFSITATSTTIYFIIDLGTTATTPIVPTGFTASWSPSNSLSKASTGTQVFTQSLHNFGSKSVSIVSTLKQGTTTLGSGSYLGSSNKTFSYTINWADVNAGTIISKMIVTVSDGNVYTFTQTYTIFSSFGSSYNIIYGLQHGLKFDMECVDDALIPCYPLMIIAIIISIAVGLYASSIMGQFGGQSAGIVFLIIMILFTFLTWIPVWLTAGLVIIMLAFLVNERRS
jgi:hypothetical protein